MTKLAIKSDGNGGYVVPTRLANTLMAGIFTALLTVIGSIIVWWGQHGASQENTHMRLISLEEKVGAGVLRVADIRLTALEIRAGSIERTQADMNGKLDTLILEIRNGRD